jgi:hypothetical protein
VARAGYCWTVVNHYTVIRPELSWSLCSSHVVEVEVNEIWRVVAGLVQVVKTVADLRHSKTGRSLDPAEASQLCW